MSEQSVESRKLMGGRHYSSHVPWVWLDDYPLLRLTPRKVPLFSQLVLCIAALPTLCYLGYRALLGRSTVSDGALLAIFTAIPVLVIAVFVAYYWFQLKAGPWISINKNHHELALPRAGVTLKFSDVQSVQVLEGVLGQGGADPTRVCELNLIVSVGAEHSSSSQTKRVGVLGVCDRKAAEVVAGRLRTELGLEE